jgi:penicillin-binding protein 2
MARQIPPTVRCARQLKLLAFFVTCGLSAILFRLYDLQIRQRSTLYLMSQKNFLRIEKVTPLRGNILDTNGNLLATNRPVVNVCWNPTGNNRLDTQQKEAIAILESIVGQELLTTYSIQLHERLSKKIALLNDLNVDQLSQIAEQLPACENLIFDTEVKRFYPHATLASHLVGFLGQVKQDPVGKMGFEKFLEPTLHGQEGEVERIINSLGKNIAERELKLALSGEDIRTTLDIQLQQMAETAFGPDYVGTMLVMCPKTGALRALVSRPSFDPNLFLAPLEPTVWKELQANKAFLNRAFDTSYPPASIFKLVSISAAIEKGIIDPESSMFCKGYYHFGNNRHWCKQHLGHGHLSIKQALAKSCNILFYHIGKHIHIDTLADYAHRFGLGSKTPMLFNSLDGLVPTTQWKLAVKKERWWPGETLSVAIGQSYLLTTPIQIARMIGSIFEGYLVNPRMLEQEPIETTPLLIQKSTRDFLKDSMRSVIKIGSGVQMSHIKDIDIYGKTGTAQTSSLTLRDQNEAFLEHGWFVTYFRYKNEDPLVLVILAEKVATSSVAVHIAKDFILAYRDNKRASEQEVA